MVTAGADNTTRMGVSCNALRIQGYAYGAQGLREGLSRDPDDCIFANASTESPFGKKVKTRVRAPLMTGALCSTFVATRYWDSIVGGALCGVPVVGESVVDVDRKSEIAKTEVRKGKIKKAPELERRIRPTFPTKTRNTAP